MSKARLLANVVTSTGAISSDVSITAPSVTATTDNLTLSAISTGNVNLATLGGTQFKAIEATGSVNVWNIRGGDGVTTSPRFTTEGTGTNIAGQFNTKGTGALQFFSGNTEQMRITNTASAVNYVQVTGSVTGASASALGGLLFTGSDTNPNFAITTKGTGYIAFCGSGATNNQSFRISNAYVANTGNLFQVQSVGAGFAPSLSVISGTSGTDANISMAFQPKGTGAIDLAAGSRGVNISNGGTVTAITRTAVGSGYTTFPNITISAPTTAGGVQATANVTSMVNIAATVASGGTGYTVGDTLSMVGGTAGVAGTFVVSSVSGGVVTGITFGVGQIYTALPTNPVSTTGGTGTGCTLNVTYQVTAFTITNAGSGYIEQPTITFSGGGGSGAAAYANIGSSTIVRGLAATSQFHLPSGEAFRLTESGGTSVVGLNVINGSSSQNTVYMYPYGSAVNPNIIIGSKGTGFIGFGTGSNNDSNGTRQFNVAHTASAVNYAQVNGGTTLNPPVISAQGSDSAIGLLYQAKGGQNHRFYSSAGSAEQFRITHTAGTIANYASVTGNVAGSAPSFSVGGSDTNIDLKLTPKGSGGVAINSDIKLGSGLDSGTSGQVLTSAGAGASPTWAAVSVTPTAVSDQANSSTGYFDLPVGTTEQRPASPGNGMIRFNTTINYIEYYDESAGSWIPISSPPSITSISPTSYNGEQGTVITINGILFSSGAVVKFITNSGTEYAASTTTFISSTQLTATTPQDFTVAQEPLSIKVENSSGLSATLSSALDCGGTPTWVTASGTLLTITEGSSVSTTVSATDPDSGATISYSISSGSLPSGVSLNSSTGAITGTAGLVASDTTYTFGITATDNAGNTSERSFNIVVQNIPDPQLLLNSYNQSETNVTGSFTIPTGMNRLYLFGCGGGGGGGLVTSQDNGCGAGGGGAANISGNYITVSGGQVYNYQIGARGNANGGGGGTTSVTLNGGSAVMTLAGGGGGGNSGGSGGGSGGSASGLAGGVSGGNGGVGGIRNNRSGGSGDSVTNGCGGGGGGGGHVSPQGGGTGGTATVSVGTFTKGSITISFAGVAGGSPGSTGAGQQLAPNVLDSLGGGGNGQDGNTGQGGGAGGGIRPTVNGTAYPRYYGGGGGGNRSYISGGTTSDGRNSGSGAGGFLIAVATQNV